jgi:hypothetical protein
MATFMTDLWESIFTPGPTPTLLIAANASFGALQVTLFGLFLATYSAHFIALSVICAGVWWGINWFAVELRKAQAAEEEAARIRKARSEKSAAGTGAETSGGEAGSEGEEEEGEETEVERDGPFEGKNAPPKLNKLNIRGGPQKILAVAESARLARQGDGAEAQGTGLEPRSEQSGLLKRTSAGEGSTADLSSVGTDSEWEKVSEGGS